MLSTTSFVILVILTAAVILLGILLASERSIQEKRIRTKMEGLQNGTLEMFPQEFMTMRKIFLSDVAEETTPRNIISLACTYCIT